MSKIIEAGDLPEQEKVYLKHDFMGYRVVNPIKNPDGTINWFNLLVGGKRGLITLIILMSIATLLYFGIQQLIANYQLIAAEPCKFCTNCFSKTIIKYQELNFTLPKFNG
jgi:hypothetical protein